MPHQSNPARDPGSLGVQDVKTLAALADMGLARVTMLHDSGEPELALAWVESCLSLLFAIGAEIRRTNAPREGADG